MEKKPKKRPMRKSKFEDPEFFRQFAIDYLHYLGNPKPTPKQIAEMEFLLMSVFIRLPIGFNIYLTWQEKQCLYLTAQGKTVSEVAAFFRVSIRQITNYRKSIFEKLNCKTMSSAIILGVRFGVLNPVVVEKAVETKNLNKS